jgi:hypothetical protein
VTLPVWAVRRSLAATACLALVAMACDRAVQTEPPSPPPASSPSASQTPPLADPTGTQAVLPPVPEQRLIVGPAARAMRALCPRPEPVTTPAPSSGEVPAGVHEIEDQVAAVRGLEWRRPVVAEAVDDVELDRLVREAFRSQYPAAQYARRTSAWRTIGVIGPHDDLRRALLSFAAGQVAGFYNPQNGELVFRSGADLGVTERFTLAHELTHAIDDQHFDLRRLDTLASQCRDEEVQAALGAIEGSAQHFATLLLTSYPPSLEDVAAGVGDMLSEALLAPAGVPPFVTSLLLFPYSSGQSFVGSLERASGPPDVNAALRTWPPTTEQILHPDRYPTDRPTPVEVPDLGGALGSDWRDLDVMQIGEEWLNEMLALRLDGSTADEAASGWDGGGYWAWANGAAAVVVMRTVWDTPADAASFADALDRWLAAGSVPGDVLVRDQVVDALFATDEQTASVVRSAFLAVPASIRT